MKVRYKDFRGHDVETDLFDYLDPRDAYHGSGAIEETRADVSNCSHAIGRLAELLVEKGVIDLNEAAKICGKYGDVELIEEN